VRGSFNERHRYEVALFTIDVEDELIPREVTPGRNAFENAGQSTRDGVEFSLISNPTERLRTTVSYTYSDFKFDEFVDLNNSANNFSGNRIPGTAENVAFGELSYTHPRGWYAAGDVIYVDKQFGDNANTVAIEDYTVTNLRFGYEADLGDFALSPFVGVNNVFDETYTANVRLNPFAGRYYEPAPGRNGYAGLTLNYKFR
jgi:iron complex outermembrane receptor protein